MAPLVLHADDDVSMIKRSHASDCYYLRESFAGVVAGVTTDLIFYGLDSYKTQSQSRMVDVRRLYRGALPTIVLGTVPQMALFFGIYEAVKLRCQGVGQSSAVLLASFIASIPASLIGVPSDVIKKVTA